MANLKIPIRVSSESWKLWRVKVRFLLKATQEVGWGNAYMLLMAFPEAIETMGREEILKRVRRLDQGGSKHG